MNDIELTGRTEIKLRENKHICLLHNNINNRIDLNDRVIDRIAMSVLDYGSFQDRNVIVGLLTNLANAQYKLIDETDVQNAAKFDALERKRLDWEEQVKKLKVFDPGFNHFPFLNYWFLSLSQLLMIIRYCTNNEDFANALKSTRHATFGVGNFYYEFYHLFILKQENSGSINIIMIKTITYTDFDVFYEFNDEYLHNNFVVTFYLIKMLEKVREGEIGIYELYNIIDDADSSRFIVALKVDENYLINGTNWNSEMIDTLVQKVKLKKYKRWIFSGTKSLITELFKSSNCTFHLFKDRLCYKCEEINSAYHPVNGDLEMAMIEDIDELSQISLAYSISEYQEEARDYTHMRNIVLGGIANKNFFVWRDKGEICSVAQIIYNEEEPPIIGHLYTVESKRNKGYAGAILHGITQNLLRIGHPGCVLVSDKNNPASNKVFEKVGYKVKGEHISVSREI